MHCLAACVYCTALGTLCLACSVIPVVEYRRNRELIPYESSSVSWFYTPELCAHGHVNCIWTNSLNQWLLFMLRSIFSVASDAVAHPCVVQMYFWCLPNRDKLHVCMCDASDQMSPCMCSAHCARVVYYMYILWYIIYIYIFTHWPCYFARHRWSLVAFCTRSSRCVSLLLLSVSFLRPLVDACGMSCCRLVWSAVRPQWWRRFGRGVLSSSDNSHTKAFLLWPQPGQLHFVSRSASWAPREP